MLKIAGRYLSFCFFLFFAYNLQAFCPASKQWVASGDSSPDFERDWEWQEVPASEIPDCRFSQGYCSWYYQVWDNGVKANGLGSDGCYFNNSRNPEEGYAANCPFPVPNPISGGVTPSLLDQLNHQYVSDQNANDWGRPVPFKVYIVKTECSAAAPPAFELASAKDRKPREDNTCSATGAGSFQSGSIIDSRSQTLGQSIPIIGTDFTLDYSTANNNLPSNYNLEFFLPPPSLNSSVPGQWDFVSATVTKTIAGLSTPFTHTFPASSIDPNYGASHTFNWDGKDSNGNFLPLPVEVRTETKYNFSTGWTSNPEVLSHESIDTM